MNCISCVQVVCVTLIFVKDLFLNQPNLQHSVDNFQNGELVILHFATMER